MPQRNKNLTEHFYYLAPKLLAFLLTILLITVAGNSLKAQINNFNNDEDISGISSLMNAVVNNDIEGVKFFVKAGSDVVNQKNLGGATPLHLAARNGYTEITNILIENGADVNAIDNEKWTPLMRAAAAKNPQITSLLIDKGADAKKYNINGETAIMHSADSECSECLYNILNKSDLTQMDNNDLRDQINQAYTITRNKNNNEMQTMLSDYLTHLNDAAARKTIEENAAVAAITSPSPENLVTEDAVPKSTINNLTADNLSDDTKKAKNEEIVQPITSAKIPNNKKTEKLLRYRFTGEVRSKEQKSEWKNTEDNNNINSKDLSNVDNPLKNGQTGENNIPKSNKVYIFKKIKDSSNTLKTESSLPTSDTSSLNPTGESLPTQEIPLDKALAEEQSHPVVKYRFKKLEDQAPAVTRELISELRRLKKESKNKSKTKAPISSPVKSETKDNTNSAAPVINDSSNTQNTTPNNITNPAENISSDSSTKPVSTSSPAILPEEKANPEAKTSAPTTSKYILTKPKSKMSSPKSELETINTIPKKESNFPAASPNVSNKTVSNSEPHDNPVSNLQNNSNLSNSSKEQSTLAPDNSRQKKIFKLRKKTSDSESAN